MRGIALKQHQCEGPHCALHCKYRRPHLARRRTIASSFKLDSEALASRATGRAPVEAHLPNDDIRMVLPDGFGN
jgi:hypothetical protein